MRENEARMNVMRRRMREGGRSPRARFAACLVSLVAGGLAPGCIVVGFRDGHDASLWHRARDEAAIRGVLADQTRAWNAGDLEGFLDGYWRSPDLRFVGKKGERRGWDTTFAAYRAAYGDGADLGTLSFALRHVELLGEDAAFVYGTYHLEHAENPSDGYFTLLLRRTEDGWRIVHDHSSADEPESETADGEAAEG